MSTRPRLHHYSYDSLENPWCAGGGAYRDLSTHRLLTHKYDIHFFVGNFKGARQHCSDGITFHYLGFKGSYLGSRLSYTLLATLHSLFSQCTLNVVAFSAFSPVLSFLLKPGRIIIEFHHFLKSEAIHKYGIFGLFPMAFEAMLLWRARYFITSADGIADTLRQSRQGKHVQAVYNGFESDLLSDAIDDKGFILAFGRLDIRMKGLDILIPAFERIAADFPEIRLVIAGRGTPENVERIKSMILNSSAKPRIELYSSVSASQKKELLHGATFVCIPSRFEGWCIVAIEAAAGSKAVLGTRIPGLIDTVQDEINGRLIEPGSIDALAEGIRSFLRDRATREKFGRSGYVWAQRFTWESTAHLQDSFYENYQQNQWSDK